MHLLAAFDFNLRTLPDQLVTGIYIGAVYALIALGYTMVYGVLRLINFAHGEVYMLGAYGSLFASWYLGFGPEAMNPAKTSPLFLGLMMLASMAICAFVGVVIERFAYRPLRSHSRISALITAIGVSLLLQYGGALFLPNSPPPSINEKVNPYRETKWTAVMVSPSAAIKSETDTAQKAFDELNGRYQAYLKQTGGDEFNLPAEGQALKTQMQESRRSLETVQAKAQNSSVQVTLLASQLFIIVIAVILMLLLRHLVLFTSVGRAMRAVSHDFESASLMGINVNKIITITFVIGSSLAGSAAMMTATLLGTPLTTQYGFVPGLKAFVAAVLGGIGNIPGAVVGGLLMGLAETLVVWMGWSQYKDAVAFVVLIVVLLFKPGGLLGSAKVEKV